MIGQPPRKPDSHQAGPDAPGFFIGQRARACGVESTRGVDGAQRSACHARLAAADPLGAGFARFRGVNGAHQKRGISPPRSRAFCAVAAVLIGVTGLLTMYGCATKPQRIIETGDAQGDSAALVFHTPAVRESLRSGGQLSGSSRWEHARRDASLGVRETPRNPLKYFRSNGGESAAGSTRR